MRMRLPIRQAIPTETNVVYKLHSSTHTWKTRQYQFWVVVNLSQSTISFIYKENIIMNMNNKKSRIPYERHAGNMTPESSKKGKPFVDFNKIMKSKPVKVVKRRVKKSAV